MLHSWVVLRVIQVLLHTTQMNDYANQIKSKPFISIIHRSVNSTIALIKFSDGRILYCFGLPLTDANWAYTSFGQWSMEYTIGKLFNVNLKASSIQ